MFELRPGEAAMYGHEPMVKKYAEHLKAFLGQEEWSRRREAVANFFFQTLIGDAPDATGRGRYFDDRDQFAWYLFLAEAFNDHPQNYEVVFGSRVVPIFSALGRNLDNLINIKGYESRLRRLISSDASQPNGAFFELLVGAAYVRDGYDVAFHDERPGMARTHDLDVKRNSRSYAVECKRMEGGAYHETERQKMRELWRRPASLLAHLNRSIYLDVSFKVELPQVRDTYLEDVASQFLRGRTQEFRFDDGTASGIIRDLDLQPLKAALKRSFWLYPGPQYHEKLLGRYRRYDSLILLQKVKFAPNPHFIDDVDLAIAARWTSLSEAAIERKARDVLSKVAEANRQLPDNVPGVVHIGFETLGGDEIERRRYEKIKSNVSNFNSESKPLEAVFCHYFSPEAPPNETWAFDETCHYHAKRQPVPLSRLSLVLPDDLPFRAGFHWDGRG
jgi:hypothetical protein